MAKFVVLIFAVALAIVQSKNLWTSPQERHAEESRAIMDLTNALLRQSREGNIWPCADNTWDIKSCTCADGITHMWDKMTDSCGPNNRPNLCFCDDESSFEMNTFLLNFKPDNTSLTNHDRRMI